MTDLATLPSSLTSRLQLVWTTPGQKVKVKVGQGVVVRVHLRDESGRAVSKGGHLVRVWLVGKDDTPRAAAVDVTDLRNGTYVASLPALWGGKVEVRAAVMVPRELYRVLLVLLDRMKMTGQIAATFASHGTEQVQAEHRVKQASVFWQPLLHNRERAREGGGWGGGGGD